jgi:hypothetical protein
MFYIHLYLGLSMQSDEILCTELTQCDISDDSVLHSDRYEYPICLITPPWAWMSSVVSVVCCQVEVSAMH